MSTSVAGHQHAVRALLSPLATRDPEPAALTTTLGRVLAADVHSPIALPVFANSQMDGYAVAAASVGAPPAQLPVLGVLAAGGPGNTALPPGTAVKIMTGAPIPSGADCVVPVEDTTLDNGIVTILRSREPGEFVRAAGTDTQAGAVLAIAGTQLAPRHIGAFAAAGLTSVPVRPLVRAAVISTGDELVAPGTPLAAGQIYNSNGAALAAALQETGTTVVSVVHSRDEAAGFIAKLAVATANADLVITSGGISMGDFEVVRECLSPQGGTFGPVAMQPGGPQGLSTIAGVPILSFPGNPVSALVSFIVFARPVLRELAGLPAIKPHTAVLTAPVRSPAGKCQFLRGTRDGDTVIPAARAGSHLVAGMAHADALIEVPAGVAALPAGSDVRVWPL